MAGPSADGTRVFTLPLRDLRAGARDAVPILVGIVPFGLVAGYTALEAGLSPLQALGMSVVIFAGASQLAAIELLGQNAPLSVVVATAVAINLRLVMYSASIAPYFRRFRTRTKAVLAYVLTDQAFALSVAAYRDADRTVDRRAYYLGAALALWAPWQVATLVGAVLGAGLPPELGLSFAAPLVFLALLVPAVDSRPDVAAAIVGGGVALLAEGVPYDAGLLLGAGAGVGAALAVERAAGDEGDVVSGEDARDRHVDADREESPSAGRDRRAIDGDAGSEAATEPGSEVDRDADGDGR
jgi:4-azaleucine resistance transporter AzlC